MTGRIRILSKTHFSYHFGQSECLENKTARKYHFHHFQISCVSYRTKTSGILRFLQNTILGKACVCWARPQKLQFCLQKLSFSITIFNLPFCSVSTNKFLSQKYHFVELPFSRARTVNEYYPEGGVAVGYLRVSRWRAPDFF